MAGRVLVTGGGGFLGSHIVTELVSRGYSVRVADNFSAPGSSSPKRSDVESLRVDLRDGPGARAAFEDIDVCIAAAAKSGGIGFFNKRPAEILDDNLRILSSTFEAARTRGIRRIVYVSSSCVFDRSPTPTATEALLSSTPPPPSGYPFSKLVGEYYCRAYAQQFGLPYTIIRPFNLYGPGEAAGKEPGDSHVIPDLTAKLLVRRIPIEIFGDGQQTRSFTHVRDAARGLVLAMESPRAENEDFNIGCPSEISILKLARLLWEMCDVREPFVFKSVEAFPNDIKRRAVDITKARNQLGWEPRIELRDGLLGVVDWLRAQMTVGRLR
jgi:nucleoside-diphosphate-sugar epimerase